MSSEYGFRGPIQGVTTPPNLDPKQRYSAAKAREGFTLAADIMKSEIRGTISERKREPLNTP